MTRSVLGALILFAGTFWLPVWLQIVLLVAVTFLLPYKWLFLIPAVFYDTFYSPTNSFTFHNFKMTIIVVTVIVVCELINRNMRIGERYGVLEK